MSETERTELEKIHQRARESFRALPPEQKVERLKNVGILDSSGRLSSRYGGEGADTSSEEARVR